MQMPGMNITINPKLRRISNEILDTLTVLKEVWYIRDVIPKITFQGKKYTYAIVAPTQKLIERFHLRRDIVVIFEQESNFSEHNFILFTNWIISKNQVDKLCVILISKDNTIKSTITDLINKDSESRIIIPFTFNEYIIQNIDDKYNLIVDRLKDFFYERDLFNHLSPLANDTYFFGRNDIVQDFYERYKSGENSGLFGLRKIGKTSVLYALKRRLEFREEPVVFIDCESIHIKRWNEVLKSIIDRLVSNFPKLQNQSEIISLNQYNEKEAQESFEKDLKTISNSINNGRILIILDEIEHLTFETSPSDHWRDGNDFLFFWQTIRATFQNNRQIFSFIIAGTNPKAIETTMLSRDCENPIRSLIPATYLGGFKEEYVKEMVSSIGSYMGMDFEESIYQRLVNDFGGSPFLIRQACSFLHKNYGQKKPFQVSLNYYESQKESIDKSLGSSIDLILETLKARYNNEYELLKYLAIGDKETFLHFIKESRTYIDHVEKYGLIIGENENYKFCIKAVEDRLKEIAFIHSNPVPSYTVNLGILNLIAQGETPTSEFKSTLSWDIKNNKKNPELIKEVLKAITSFMNTKGGTLLIGVADNQEIIGLDYDFKILRTNNTDVFSRHLSNNILANELGGNLSCLCNITFPKIGNKTICRVDVSCSNEPVTIQFRTDIKKPFEETFFCRNNNGAKSLKGKDLINYCLRRFS